MAVQIIDAGESTFTPIFGLDYQYRLTVPASIAAGDVMVVVMKYNTLGTNLNAIPIAGWSARFAAQFITSPEEREFFVFYYKEKQPNEQNTYELIFSLGTVTGITVLKTYSVSGSRRSLSGMGGYSDQEPVSGTGIGFDAAFIDPFSSSISVHDGGAGLMVVLGNPWATTSSITAHPASMIDQLGGIGPRYFLGVENFVADEVRPANRSFTCDQTGAPVTTYAGFRSASIVFAPAFNANMFHGTQF